MDARAQCDRARTLAWCREVRRSDRVAEDKASGIDTRADLEGSSSNSPADRPGRSPRRAGSRCGGEGDDHLGSRRQREDVAAARVGRPSGPAASARRRPGATRPAGRPAVLARPAGRGPSGLRHSQPRGTASSDTRLQRAGDGRPGAVGARRCVATDIVAGHRRSARAALAGGSRPAHPPADEPSRQRARGRWPRAAICGCACISSAWPASWPRSARRICASPSARPASCSRPRGSRCPRPGWRCCTSGPKGGPRACGWRRSRWPVTPTRSGSWPSSPAATARSPSTCSPRCWTASPDDVQQLLLRTSLLDRVNGELADLLTGRPGSERILLDLEDANAFVVSLDPERTWFRYHHLFADFLRLELRRTRPEEVPALHRRAAGWFVRHGQVVDAIRHTQAAGDWPEAARLLADHSFSLTLDGQAADHPGAAAGLPAGSRAMTPSWPWCAPRMTCSTDTWTRRPPTWRSPRPTSRRRHQIASAASGWRSRR